jgi:nicotinamide mononucleotide adenylyltransferase
MIKGFKDFLVEDTKEVSFVFGRFNPPTIGHAKLFGTLQKVSGKEYRIYSSKSVDKKKNPLDFKTKVKFLRKMFPKHGRKIMGDKDIRTVFDVLTVLYTQGFTQVNMVAGSDRVNEFNKLLNKYNGVKGKHGFYQFEGGIKIISAGSRDPDAEGASGMSASKMREAATDGDIKTFSMGVPEVQGDSQIGLYNAVRKGMGLKPNIFKEGHIQLESVSEIREDYIKGKLFSVGDEVIELKSQQVGIVERLLSNYVLVKFGNIKKRCWLDSVEKINEEVEEWGTDSSVKNYKKNTPGEGVTKFADFIKDEDEKDSKTLKITPEIKKEIEAIAKKLDDQDFQAKYGSDWKKMKIATAVNIIKRKKGLLD